MVDGGDFAVTAGPGTSEGIDPVDGAQDVLGGQHVLLADALAAEGGARSGELGEDIGLDDLGEAATRAGQGRRQRRQRRQVDVVQRIVERRSTRPEIEQRREVQRDETIVTLQVVRERRTANRATRGHRPDKQVDGVMAGPVGAIEKRRTQVRRQQGSRSGIEGYRSELSRDGTGRGYNRMAGACDQRSRRRGRRGRLIGDDLDVSARVDGHGARDVQQVRRALVSFDGQRRARVEHRAARVIGIDRVTRSDGTVVVHRTRTTVTTERGARSNEKLALEPSVIVELAGVDLGNTAHAFDNDGFTVGLVAQPSAASRILGEGRGTDDRGGRTRSPGGGDHPTLDGEVGDRLAVAGEVQRAAIDDDRDVDGKRVAAVEDHLAGVDGEVRDRDMARSMESARTDTLHREARASRGTRQVAQEIQASVVSQLDVIGRGVEGDGHLDRIRAQLDVDQAAAAGDGAVQLEADIRSSLGNAGAGGGIEGQRSELDSSRSIHGDRGGGAVRERGAIARVDAELTIHARTATFLRPVQDRERVVGPIAAATGPDALATVHVARDGDGVVLAREGEVVQARADRSQGGVKHLGGTALLARSLICQRE